VSGTKYPKAVSGATGTFIPGLGTFWPDQTIDQINRISDLGYQTNKVISKQGSDIIVCFFPIDRFLTKGFKKIFLSDPALFFSPFELLVDSAVDIKMMLPDKLFGSVTPDQMREALPCYLFNSHKPAAAIEPLPANQVSLATYCAGKPAADVTAALETLKGVSLNTIRVVVDGVMTVDTTTMKAKIDNVAIDNDTLQSTWTVTGSASAPTISGTITGSYLTGGTPVIQEAKDDQITKVQVVTDGSNDQTLKFSFVLGKSLSTGDHLTFVVEKATKDSKTAPVDSAPLLYVVPTLKQATGSAETQKPESGAQTGETGGGVAQPSRAPSTPGATKPAEQKKQVPPPEKK
jgi:hypothetical protein